MLQRMLALLVLALVVAACGGPATSTLTVTNLAPADGAIGVPVDTVVSATFNLGIDVDTLDGAFTLSGGGETIEGDLSYNAGTRTATFTPDSNLAFGTLYTATVDGTVATDDGVALGGAASWSFTTVGVPGLTVTNRVPADGATGVAVDTVVSATFNLGIDVDTLDGAFTLTGGGETVEGDLTYNAGTRTATFTPNEDLTPSTIYTATLAGTVATDDDIALGDAASWSFTTVTESGGGTMAFIDATTYTAFVGDADITTAPFTRAFPAFDGAQGDVTYTLHSGALPPPFEAQAYTNPETDEDFPAATYTVTLDAGTGAIGGVTGFPGTFSGVVRATDTTGDFLDAPFSLDLAFVMAYDGALERFVTDGPGIAVEGARVTISGTNALALPATGMERVFSLTYVPGASSGDATAGAFQINTNDGTISKVEDDSTFPSVWVYDVFATHTATGLVSDTFRFTFTLIGPNSITALDD